MCTDLSKNNIKKVSEEFYYVDCSCGAIAKRGATPEAAAENWNKEMREDFKPLDRWWASSPNTTELEENGAKNPTILVIFESQGANMYASAKTGAEAKSLAISLSKTYGAARIKDSVETGALFINGEPVPDDGRSIWK